MSEQKLKEKLSEYDEQGISIFFSEEPMCVLILTPLMKRAHGLPMASEIVFVDTTSSCDPGQHSVTFLLTPCAAGSAPLGVIITSGQSTSAYAAGFSLLKNNFDAAFNNIGYPKLFMTDNSLAEIEALKQVWPSSDNLLCIFHVLQAVWRWLWTAKNEIPQDRRSQFMSDFQTILYAPDLIEMSNFYENCLDRGRAYPRWITYVQSYWLFKEKWCLAYRSASVRGHHTNNFAEAAIRVFKDVILSRVKAYNVISLIDFSCTTLEAVYRAKFRDFANFRNRKSFLYFRNTLKKVTYLTKDDVIEVSPNSLFLVRSEQDPETFYTVNVEVGQCTCNFGKYGRFCKHECAVYQYYDIHSPNFPLIKPEDRFRIMLLAVGADKCPDRSFYSDDGEILSSLNPEMGVENEDITDRLFVGNVGESEHQVEKIADTGHFPDADGDDDDGSQVHAGLDHRDNTIENICELLLEKVDQFGHEDSVQKALLKYKSRIESIRTLGQFEQFLYCIQTKRYKAGARINVMPTGIARRKPGITRGAKRLPAGRHSKSEHQPSTKKKRIHSLTKNVRNNLKN